MIVVVAVFVGDELRCESAWVLTLRLRDQCKIHTSLREVCVLSLSQCRAVVLDIKAMIKDVESLFLQLVKKALELSLSHDKKYI